MRLCRDDAGSLPMAILLTFLGMTLTAGLVPVVVGQFEDTRFSDARSSALHAAQAGLDVGMGQIRVAHGVPSASDPVGGGELRLLPCGPFSGDVDNGTASRPTYSVSIAYYNANPRTASSTQITCTPGAGTTVTPAAARLTSTGTDPVTGDSRTLSGTYTFQTTNTNVAGGQIRAYSSNLCMEGGTDLTMQACVEGDEARQRQFFAYNADLTISLYNSGSEANPRGLCLDGGSPETAGNRVTLRPCANPTQPQQQWNFDSSAGFKGTTKEGDILRANNLCLALKAPNTAGSILVLTTSCSGVNATKSFNPAASVGAGAAGAENGQLVNYSQFGRCIDVTEVRYDKGYLIVWPCKQTPDPTKLDPNQLWAVPAAGASGQITSTYQGVRYCLRSPADPATGRYPSMVSCPISSAPPARTTWTMSPADAEYRESYRISLG